MEIRPAKSEDYAAMARLRRQTIRNVNSKDYSAGVIKSWVATGNAQDFKKSGVDRKRWVAHKEDKLVGFSEHNLHGQVSRIYVHKDYLRRGVGSRLLKVAEESIRESGHGEIWIESTVTAKDFYEMNGYEVIQKSVNAEYGAVVYKMFKL